jgi:hypothetical protein
VSLTVLVGGDDRVREALNAALPHWSAVAAVNTDRRFIGNELGDPPTVRFADRTMAESRCVREGVDYGNQPQTDFRTAW